VISADSNRIEIIETILSFSLKKIRQLAGMFASLFLQKNTYYSYVKQKQLHLILWAGAIFLLSACSHQPAEKKFRIGFSQCQSDDAWRKKMMDEMKRELSFHNNIEFIFKDAEASTQKQIQQIDELVKQNIDLLIVSPNEAQPLTPVIEKVYTSGIPVVLIDRGINSAKYTAFVGASNFEVGQNAGRYTVSLLKGKGDIIEVMGLSDATPFIDRHKGFVDVVSKNPGIHLLKTIQDHAPNYESDLENTLLINRNISLIFAQTDYIALAVYRICKKTGTDKKIKIIGVDGLPIDSLGMGMVASNMLAATVLYPTGGQEAIVTALKILDHQSYSKENTLATTIIDSSNVRIMKLQNDKVTEQQADIDKRQKKIEEQILISKNQTDIILAISITLALALIFGGILFYYLQENKKINKKLEQQKEEISSQRNQLIELMARVKEANDARVNFFTNISHELRTPLTLIMAPLEDSLASPKLHFTIKNNLEFIHRNSIRLLRLINQLMDFRKMEEGKMKFNASENNITAFVTDITGTFNDTAKKKHISLNVISKTKELQVWIDVTMMDKVLFNLLSNAFKFTPENGTINVIIDKSTTNETAVIKVEDDGVGMNADDAAHAFEMFYQGHSSTFKGTGLGLSLSKQLINLHHGDITVKSEKGKGTCFEIRLPLGKSHLQPHEILSETPPMLNTYEDAKIYSSDIEKMVLLPETDVPVQKENTVLIIEDNDDLRAFLKQRLGSVYELHEAATGEAGCNLAFDIVPDLIISDIVLPGQNGLQLTELLKHDLRTSHIPIILLTAKGSIEEQIEGIKSQADAFIVKPFNVEYLEETIKTVLKNRAVLREHYTNELPTETRSNSSSKIDRKFINEFTAIVENNISNEDFSVDDIGKKIGISRVQLYRKVKALLGYNVNDYILTVRLQKAKYLLLHEELSIAEIAFKVGFASQAYFSTVFKSKFSVTPKAFKEGKGNQAN
jgi:signal transduction histidine kinase/DNA-binding response OmpR family regulator/ABC-type xylose transport system substrate-binding protein